MARREVISIRVSEGTAQAIDQVRGGTSRAKWVEELIVSELDDSREEAELAKAIDTDFAEARKTERCNHPRARVIKGFCYRCGSMVLPK